MKTLYVLTFSVLWGCFTYPAKSEEVLLTTRDYMGTNYVYTLDLKDLKSAPRWSPENSDMPVPLTNLIKEAKLDVSRRHETGIENVRLVMIRMGAKEILEKGEQSGAYERRAVWWVGVEMWVLDKKRSGKYVPEDVVLLANGVIANRRIASIDSTK